MCRGRELSFIEGNNLGVLVGKGDGKVAAQPAQVIRVLPNAEQERYVGLAIAHRDNGLDVHAAVWAAKEKDSIGRIHDSHGVSSFFATNLH